jgi:hypothetical protein
MPNGSRWDKYAVNPPAAQPSAGRWEKYAVEPSSTARTGYEALSVSDLGAKLDAGEEAAVAEARRRGILENTDWAGLRNRRTGVPERAMPVRRQPGEIAVMPETTVTAEAPTEPVVKQPALTAAEIEEYERSLRYQEPTLRYVRRGAAGPPELRYQTLYKQPRPVAAGYEGVPAPQDIEKLLEAGGFGPINAIARVGRAGAESLANIGRAIAETGGSAKQASIAGTAGGAYDVGMSLVGLASSPFAALPPSVQELWAKGVRFGREAIINDPLHPEKRTWYESLSDKQRKRLDEAIDLGINLAAFKLAHIAVKGVKGAAMRKTETAAPEAAVSEVGPETLPIAEPKVAEAERAATVPPMERPAVPTFKETTEAEAFGAKAGPDQVAELQRLERESRQEIERLRRQGRLATNEGIQLATRVQLYSEALRASESGQPKQTSIVQPNRYYVNEATQGGERKFNVAAGARPLKLPGFESFDLFVAPAGEGRFEVYEAKTGLRIGDGATAGEAAASALSAISGNGGAKGVANLIQASVARTGLSPRYGLAVAVPEEGRVVTSSPRAELALRDMKAGLEAAKRRGEPYSIADFMTRSFAQDVQASPELGKRLDTLIGQIKEHNDSLPAQAEMPLGEPVAAAESETVPPELVAAEAQPVEAGLRGVKPTEEPKPAAAEPTPKMSNLDESEYWILPRLGGKEVVPGWVVDRSTGKVKMRDEYAALVEAGLPKSRMDLRRPTVEELQKSGGGTEGNLDELATEYWARDAEDFRAKLIAELERWKSGRKPEPQAGEPVAFERTAAGEQGVLVRPQARYPRPGEGIRSPVPEEKQLAGTMFEAKPVEEPNLFASREAGAMVPPKQGDAVRYDGEDWKVASTVEDPSGRTILRLSKGEKWQPGDPVVMPEELDQPAAAPPAAKVVATWDEAIGESAKRLKETGPLSLGLSVADVSRYPKAAMSTAEKLAYVLEPLLEKAMAEATKLVQQGRIKAEHTAAYVNRAMSDLLYQHPEFRSLPPAEKGEMMREVKRMSAQVAYSAEEKTMRTAQQIVDRVESKDPIAPTREQNDAYVAELLKEAEKRVRKVTPARQSPSVVALLQARIPIYHLEGKARGLDGRELVQYVRGKLVDSLRQSKEPGGPLFSEGVEPAKPSPLQLLAPAQRVAALRKLETETVDRWVGWYQNEVAKADGRAASDKALEDVANRVQDIFLGSKLPEKQVADLLRLAQRFRVNRDNQGRFVAGFKSRVSVMADSYGAAGAELAGRLFEGDLAHAEYMGFGESLLRRIRDAYDKVENPFERTRIDDAVVRALEDRSNADAVLDTPEKKAVYADAVTMLDTFKAELKGKGYPVREDYFSHIKQADVADQVLSTIEDANRVDTRDLNAFITEKSRFLKPREEADMQIKKDVRSVLSTYLRSVSRELAYKDASQYYYTRFKMDIPQSLRGRSMQRAIQLMSNSLTPERGSGYFYRVANWIRGNQYPNFLAFSWKSALQNATQHNYARLRWSEAADALERKLWHSQATITGALADAVDIASKEVPRFWDTLRETEGVQEARLGESIRRYDTFQLAERRNWRRTELGSIIDSAMREPEYQRALRRPGYDEVDAINEVLNGKDAFDRAIRRAEITSAETQVSPSPAMRGELYDKPLHRIILMFTAFKTRQLQVLGAALGNQEGINGARAKAIMRMGLSGDVTPVEVLREVETNRKALEILLKKASEFKEDVGIPKADLKAYIDFVKSREADLNAEIKTIEPLRGGRAGQLAILGRTFAKVYGLSFAFSLLWDSVDAATGAAPEDRSLIGRAFARAFWDTEPSPFFGTDPSKFMVSPTVPNLEDAMRYGTFSWRGLTKDVVSYGLTAIPYAGIVNRASGNRISRAIVDILAPKKSSGSSGW